MTIIFVNDIDSILKSIRADRVLSALDAKIIAAEKLPPNQSAIKRGLIQQKRYALESAFSPEKFNKITGLHPRLLPDYQNAVYELRKTFSVSPFVDRIIQIFNPISQILLSQNADRVFLHAVMHIALAVVFVLIALNMHRKEK